MDQATSDGRIVWPYSGKVSEPPPHNFRDLHTGAALAECLAVTGAWIEFDLLLREQPQICPDILRWYCEPGDPEAPAFWEARRRAEVAIQQRDGRLDSEA